jgi:Putative zinc-finger
MSDERCHETRELLSEVALGIADGAERARVLEHVADCADCRRELERQSAIADGLLTLAPEQEPPIGFELGVLQAIHPPEPKRRWAIWRPLALAAVVAAAVAVTAGGMLLGFRDDRRLADQYRAALAEANGTYFGSARLADPARRPGGVLFVYRGSPSWILVTVAPQHRAASARAEIVTRDGRRIRLASFRLVDGAWGGALPLDLGDVAAVHLVGDDGRSTLVADLQSNPSGEVRR